MANKGNRQSTESTRTQNIYFLLYLRHTLVSLVNIKMINASIVCMSIGNLGYNKDHVIKIKRDINP